MEIGKFKIEANFFQQDEIYVRHIDFEMINTKMPNQRYETATQEI